MTPEEQKLRQRESRRKYDRSPRGKAKKCQWEQANTERRREYKRLKQREYRQRKAFNEYVDTDNSSVF